MNEPCKLYLFTGKGGVGKTATALSFTKYLNEQGKNALYVYFKSSSFSEDESYDQSEALTDELDIPSMGLELDECAEHYIARKLNSRIIAKGVVHAPFFRALINMIPGFNYLIYLGQILQYINDAEEKGEEITIVVDSPSSGHAMTMLEATHNFQKIFQSGIIFEDTKKMLELFYKPGFCAINIITIPTQLAVSEALELEREINQTSQIQTRIFANNSYSKINGLEEAQAPDFILKKLDIESETLKQYPMKAVLPHSLQTSTANVVKELVPCMKDLV
jgi:anion-transporting  ArsA/GET3 family ATPase